MRAMLTRLALVLLAPAAGCDAASTDQPGDYGVLVDESPGSGPDPSMDADSTDEAAPIACSESTGDESACGASADGGVTCLTASVCQALAQYLNPREAGLAMDCIAQLDPRCDATMIADCFLPAANQSCAPADPSASPCDVVAALCASGDPFDAIDYCRSIAAALTPSAASQLASCLQQPNTPCDPSTFEPCVAALFPGTGDM
ncbi:MAG TPA: hypothetical protein VFF06_06510 [Polyangia bacterium]|nr:hypothetical protein [Polyangia bacterium]